MILRDLRIRPVVPDLISQLPQILRSQYNKKRHQENGYGQFFHFLHQHDKKPFFSLYEDLRAAIPGIGDANLENFPHNCGKHCGIARYFSIHCGLVAKKKFCLCGWDRSRDGSWDMSFLTQTGQHSGELTTNYD